MATITRRGQGWSVQVRRKGYPSLYKTFSSKADAQAWGRAQENRIDQHEPAADPKLLKNVTLGDVIRRYLEEVTPRKRSEESERNRLEKLLRDALCDLPLGELTKQALAVYRDKRLRTVKPGTIRREISLIHHALDIARIEWGYALPQNPVKDLALPRLNNARTRRLEKHEVPRLHAALQQTRNKLIGPVVQFALETALRRSEILNLRWEHVHMESRIAHIPWSKTGYGRTIPLNDGALNVLSERAQEGKEGLVFPITVNAFQMAWERTRDRAGLSDFRFHDLRHEAISRFCELGLSIPEIAVISGHRDPRMLFRYAHLRPQDIAAKLAMLSVGSPAR